MRSYSGKIVFIVTIVAMVVNHVYGIQNRVLYSEKIDILSFDKAYFPSIEFKLSDGVQPTVDMKSELLQDLVDATIAIKAFQWSGTEYITTPVDVEMPVCDFIDDPSIYIIKDVVSDGVHGNFPMECTGGHNIPKGSYYLKEASVGKLPGAALIGRWRLDVKLKVGGNVISEGQWSFKVSDA